MDAINPNQQWAETFVTGLVEGGLKHVCIVPGSRSGPLVMAFAAEPKIQKFVHYDERSAAYFALGLALSSGRPAAVLVTSGTAIANLHPAVVEADASEIPLLLLSADRPHELRTSGSNQTIDQVKFFGDQVRWFVDVAPPEAEPKALAIRALRALAVRALDRTQHPQAGPVHLNFPFRKPLEPSSQASRTGGPDESHSAGAMGRWNASPLSISHGTNSPMPGMVERLSGAISESKRGWIICGPRSSREARPVSLVKLAAQTGFPLLCDGLSGLRFGSHTAYPRALLISGYEWFLSAAWHEAVEAPDFILQIGWPPVSGQLQRYLGQLESTRWIAISPSGSWRYPEFGVQEVMVTDPEQLIVATLNRLSSDGPPPANLEGWKRTHQEAEAATWQEIEQQVLSEDVEGPLLYDLLSMLPEDCVLFVANSLPVRHLDEFSPISEKRLEVLANRGASGIDGTLSTAAGFSATLSRPLVVVTGDLALIHDLNGLMALTRYAPNSTVVLINNQGGGIFNRLPIAAFEPEFTEFFLTPHELDLAAAAPVFGMKRSSHKRRASFREAILEAVADPAPHLIEFRADAAQHESVRQAVRRKIAERILQSKTRGGDKH